jgi:hypothetical protein
MPLVSASRTDERIAACRPDIGQEDRSFRNALRPAGRTRCVKEVSVYDLDLAWLKRSRHANPCLDCFLMLRHKIPRKPDLPKPGRMITRPFPYEHVDSARTPPGRSDSTTLRTDDVSPDVDSVGHE